MIVKHTSLAGSGWEVYVPVDATHHEYIRRCIVNYMYRSGLDSELNDEAQEFVSSIYSDMEIVPFDVAGTEAHVIMLYESKIITKSDAAKILTVLKEIRNGKIDVEDTNKNAEDCHEMLEGYITKKVGSKIGGKIQTGRSRNDQVATAIKMKLRHDTNMIQVYILQLIEALLEMAEDNKNTIIPLYTHLQHAQVGVLSHYFIAQADILSRDYERFSSLYDRLDSNPLGSGPVGGTNIPIDRKITTELLSFSYIQDNSLDATSTRDHMSEFASCVAIMMVNLSRMAEDLIIWSSNEFSFVEISSDLASPSSIMPQKKNPDTLELIRGKAASAIGGLTSILTIQKGLASGYGRDLQETKDATWVTSKNAQGALQMMFNILINLVIHKGSMYRAAETGHLMALDVAEKLVEKNVPFRQAHMEVGTLVGLARSNGKELIGLTNEEIESVTTVNPDMIIEIFNRYDTQASARKRRSMGSTSSNEQDRMIKESRDSLEQMFNELDEQRQQANAGMYEMWGKIDEMIKSSKRSKKTTNR